MRMLWLRVLTAAGIVSLSAGALASGPLEVSLRYPADGKGLRIDRGQGTIEVVLANRGPESIDVSERSIPKPNPDGILFDDYFDIRADTGGHVSYLGIFVSYADIEGSYIRLRPGATLVLAVDMLKNYRLDPGGSYEVKLRPIRYLPKVRTRYSLYFPAEVHQLMRRAEPDGSLSLRISENIVAQRRAIKFEDGTEDECEEWQLEEFEEARTTAHSRAAEAFAHYHNLFEGRVTPNGLEVEFKASERYTRWFGEDPAGNYWEWSEDDSYLFAMLMALPTRLESPAFTLTCSCNAKGIDPRTLAYVYPTAHYAMHACPKFWETPMLPISKDQSSRVGTIIHEASHFEDRAMPKRTDHPAQLYDDALRLAKENRSQAVLNANTYKFFVLDLNW